MHKHIFSELGARVIKIEPPWGSRSRDIGPFYKDIADREKSLFWFAYNANKRSITLDLETVDGQDLFRKLANSADVVLESFKPGYLDNLGIGYKSLSQLNPSLIMTSVTPFGQDGPKAWYNSSELAVWASAGILYISGDPDRPPSWVSFPQSYLHGGAQAAAGTLLALYHRRSLGEGQHIDAAQFEMALQFLAPEILDAQINQTVAQRMGNRKRDAAPHVTVSLLKRCAVSYCTIRSFCGARANPIQSYPTDAIVVKP